MRSFIIRLVINAVALVALSRFFPSDFIVRSWYAAFVSALALGFANALVKPVAMFILGTLTLPLSCITLGLWTLVLSWILNGILLYQTAKIIPDFGVNSFWAALWGSLALSLVNSVASGMLMEDKKKK